MKKLAKNLGRMAVGKRRSHKKGASLAVKVSIFVLAVKLISKLLFALFFVFPYSFAKRDNGWDLRAILYGVKCTKNYNEKTEKTSTSLNFYPLGIVGDQLKTAKNIVLNK